MDVNLFNKTTVRTTGIMSAKRHYASLMSAYRVKLYDGCWISNASYVWENEVRDTITGTPELVDYLTTNSGEILLDNIGMLKFASWKLPPDDEIQYFLKDYIKYLEYRDCCKSIDIVYNKLRVKRKGVTMMMHRDSIQIFYSKHFTNINKGFVSAFYPDKSIEVYDVRDKLYSLALEKLGLPDSNKEGVFIKGLSREQEVELLDLILDGIIKYEYLNGVYAPILIEWLKTQKEQQGVYAYSYLGFYTFLTKKSIDEVKACQDSVIEELQSKGKNIVCMSTDRIFCAEDLDETQFALSAFLLDYYSQEDISEQNRLNGYTGEVLELSQTDIVEMQVTGCPIMINNNKKQLKKYYIREDIGVLNSGIGEDTLFEKHGADLSFDSDFVEMDSSDVEVYIQNAVNQLDSGELIHTVNCCIEKFKEIKEKLER